MNETDKQLLDEIEKWSGRIKDTIKSMRVLDESKSDLLKNVHAYVNDSDHFMKQDKLVLSFEAMVWAWAWLEIGKRLGFWEY